MMTSLQYSLENASRTIESQTQATLAAFEEKLATPSMSAKAAIWLPKAKQAEKYKHKLIDEIDRIAKECATNGTDCKEINIVSLKTSLKEYTDSTLNVDPLITAEFSRNFTDAAGNGNSQSLSSILNRLKSPDHFNEKEQAAIFSQLKLLATQNTNAIIRFCTEQVSDPGFYYTVYSAIVSQNSAALVPGEQLEINAGLVHFP